MGPDHELIVVGTGFASTFFLERWLARRRPQSQPRVLVLEAGQRIAHADRLRGQRGRGDEFYENRTPKKRWAFERAFGGGSNCWWACTPRLLPSDFALHTNYGVGTDWPVTYDDLETYYVDVERKMAVSGDAAASPMPRSAPFPLPPHRLTAVDEVLLRAFPGSFWPMPSARPSQATETRPMCCNNGVCNLCPIDSKFTIQNTMAALYERPGVELRLGCAVQSLDLEGGRARGVTYVRDGKVERATGEVIALGANSIFNAHILLRSGLTHPRLGVGVNEQSGVLIDIDLDGLENLGGSTVMTGHGYMLYDGAHRREHAGALIETWNAPRLRMQRGKWRQTLTMKLIFEDLPRDDNRITLAEGDAGKPAVAHHGYSDYCTKGVARATDLLAPVLAKLPVERIRAVTPSSTESHVLGGTQMGHDAASSIVDGALVHHSLRNVLVLGGGAFPTSPPPNPTLTIAALSVRAADRLLA